MNLIVVVLCHGSGDPAGRRRGRDRPGTGPDRPAHGGERLPAGGAGSTRGPVCDLEPALEAAKADLVKLTLVKLTLALRHESERSQRQPGTTETGAEASEGAGAATGVARAELARVVHDIDATRRIESVDAHTPRAAAKVLATLEREWEGLMVPIAAEGDLDNNSAERALRSPVVGRKNY
jgi:hypothetical protein